MKDKDVKATFARANHFYEQSKWSKANELYEKLLPVFRGTKEYEELYYRYAYSFYNLKDYLSASYQFKNFTDLFPKSPKANETEFMYAVCLFKMSPRYSLDQTNTLRSLEVLQTYINTHPESKNLTLANNYIDIGREKIERKAKEAAQLYYDMTEFKAASVAFKALIQAFPESKDNDYYQFMVIKSFSKYADLSQKTKQEERYAEAISAFNDLKEYYPKSEYMREAEQIASSVQHKIKNLRNDNQ